MYDYHTHTMPWSPDGKSAPFDMVEAAVDAGIHEMCFTEHWDEDYPPHEDKPFDFDFAQHAAMYEALCKQTAHLPIQLHRGIEVGLMPHLYDTTAARLETGHFEFVIASIHMVDGKDPCWDSFLEGRSKQTSYGEYLMAVHDMVHHFQDYHVVGHIGYPAKADHYKRFFDDNVLRYHEFPELLDDILTQVIHTGHGIEVNTSGLRCSEEPIPSWSVLQRYRELGGEIITLGSDAHRVDHVAWGFPETIARLQAMGYRYIAVFRNGCMDMEPIG